MNAWTPLIPVALMLFAFGLRKLTPSSGFLHTAAGATVIAFASGLLGALAQAIQAHGFSSATIVPAIASFVMSFIATANPSLPADPDARTKQIDGASLRALLPLAFVALALSGCANIDWHKFGVDEAQCLAAPVKGAIADVSSDLVDSVQKEIDSGNGFDSAQWEADAKALGVKYGFAAVACAAAHLIGDLFIAGPEQVCRLKHKQAKPAHLAYLRKLLPKR